MNTAPERAASVLLVLIACADARRDSSAQMPTLAIGRNGIGGTLCVLIDGVVACTGAAATPPQSTRSEQVLTEVEGLPPARAVAITSVPHAACAVTRDDHVWCWGDQSLGATGRGPVMEDAPTQVEPRAIDGLDRVEQIVGSSHGFCVVDADRAVRCWGEGGIVVPISGRAPVWRPAVIEGLPAVIAVAATSLQACAIDLTNALWCWGLGLHRDVPTPEVVVPAGVTRFVDNRDERICFDLGTDEQCLAQGEWNP
jgi:hypothetical protein